MGDRSFQASSVWPPAFEALAAFSLYSDTHHDMQLAGSRRRRGTKSGPDVETTMTDRPKPEPRRPLVLPPNFRDVTAERIGTVIGIVGVTGAGKGDEGSA
jgi:hypothetical protein